jgi:hypothetical protein
LAAGAICKVVVVVISYAVDLEEERGEGRGERRRGEERFINDDAGCGSLGPYLNREGLAHFAGDRPELGIRLRCAEEGKAFELDRMQVPHDACSFTCTSHS